MKTYILLVLLLVLISVIHGNPEETIVQAALYSTQFSTSTNHECIVVETKEGNSWMIQGATEGGAVVSQGANMGSQCTKLKDINVAGLKTIGGAVNSASGLSKGEVPAAVEKYIST